MTSIFWLKFSAGRGSGSLGIRDNEMNIYQEPALGSRFLSTL